MRPEPPQLTQARRDYIQAGSAFLRCSARTQQAGATDETRQAMEDARLRLQVAYTEYQDLLEAVEAVA